MKSVRSAKFLTFLYFSIVALALIAIHVSVYWQTTEDLERFYGQNRLEQIRAHSAEMLAGVDIGRQPGIRIRPQTGSDLDSGTEIVFDFDLLPDWLPDPADLAYNEGLEVLSDTTDEAYFLMKTQFETATGPRDAILMMDFRLYEMSEAQLADAHIKQVAISVVLLIISLVVVVKISDRLTRPISSFADTLADKASEDLEPVPLPSGATTRELVEMVDTFNRYLERIRSLVERERSFSRYASHEMRTPLTVMRGALTLMEESDDPAFTTVQKKRLNEAVTEMSELIETLLNLARTEDGTRTASRVLAVTELEAIAREHEYLLEGKDLSWQVVVEGDPEVRMPETTFRILLGNLVKNAFTYAERGIVLIEAFPGGLKVVDNGASHTDDEHIKEGFGLGLLLVRDICHRFGWHTEHESNDGGGWTMHVTFKELEQ